MRSIWSAPLALAITVVMLFAVACEEDTTGPGTNVNQSLKATINGSEYSFLITEILSTFDDETNNVRFSGTIVGTPTRTFNVQAIADIDNGSFPQELHDPNVLYTYQVTSSGNTVSYQCATIGDDCHLTITSVENDVIKGTFSATLTNPADTLDRISVSNGSFVVKLQRQ